MQREARSDRGWEQWPGRRAPDEAGRKRLRALFLPSDAREAVSELAAEHGRELEERLAELQAAVLDLETRERAVSELEVGVEHLLRESSLELDRFQHELAQREEALDRRGRSLATAEAAAEERRRELGAVELQRAALERRADTIEHRESELERRADELATLARQLQELGGALAARDEPHEVTAHVVLLTDSGYRVEEVEGPAPAVGGIVEANDTAHRCVRITRSPFPNDRRPCAVLERLSAEEHVSD